MARPVYFRRCTTFYIPLVPPDFPVALSFPLRDASFSESSTFMFIAPPALHQDLPSEAYLKEGRDT